MVLYKYIDIMSTNSNTLVTNDGRKGSDVQPSRRHRTCILLQMTDGLTHSLNRNRTHSITRSQASSRNAGIYLPRGTVRRVCTRRRSCFKFVCSLQLFCKKCKYIQHFRILR